jgi:adenylate kinase family enzyme
MKVLKNAMKNSPSNKFLLDGFPRNFENIKGWVEAFGDNQSVKIKFVLFFDCPESEMERRLLKRGKTSGREDDNAHVIKKRFQTFMTETLPIIEYYQKNSLLKTVQAIGTQEQVFARVVEHFAKSAL